jgi:hypothetical protein
MRLLFQLQHPLPLVVAPTWIPISPFYIDKIATHEPYIHQSVASALVYPPSIGLGIELARAILVPFATPPEVAHGMVAAWFALVRKRQDSGCDCESLACGCNLSMSANTCAG